jgi:peptidoglycan/xylan/chitin deacetylase (PgdA/CDA1 family)
MDARSVLHRGVRLTGDVIARGHLVPAVRWWNRVRPGIIVVYHEITAPVLRTQLAALSRTHTFVTLDDLVARVRSGQATRGLAAITFDDGLAPVVEAAADVAAEQGWPMTFYLPTRAVDDGAPAWYQELRPLIERSSVAAAEVEGHRVRLDGVAARDEAFAVLNGLFLEAASTQRVADLLGSVRMALTGTNEALPDLEIPPTITWPRVVELAERAELSFEAHSVTHLPLGRLPRAEVVWEMEQSRARIEEVTGRRVRHFCYPFGSDPEVGTEPPDVARDRFDSAVTTARGRCRPGDDPARLPRIPMLQHEDGDLVVAKAALALALAR